MIGPRRADARRFIAYRPADPRERSLLLLRCSIGVFALETFDAARCVNQLLLAREEWVAARTDFHAYQLAFVRRPRLKRAPARAVHFYCVVIRMYSFFHLLAPSVRTGLRVSAGRMHRPAASLGPRTNNHNTRNCLPCQSALFCGAFRYPRELLLASHLSLQSAR